MRCRPYGPCAWLVDGVADPAGWAAALARVRVAGIREIVPAQDSVLVACERSRHGDIGRLVSGVVAADRAGDTGEPVVVDVVYDGADLGAAADAAGLTVEELVDIHVHGAYRVEFCGFSPGFAYLTGLDARLHLPRRRQPRTAVPAGSVAIAAGYTSVYPTASPGGWHLIGTSPTPVWDVERPEPALLLPGRAVRFSPATVTAPADRIGRTDRQPAVDPALRVVEPGWATTVQDAGRRGWAHLGVPTAGAVDRDTAARVNRMVGNVGDVDGAAVIETLGGLVVEAVRPVVVARSTDASRHTLAAGARLRVDPAPGDLWAYLAVRGGLDVEPVLGSRSHDSLSSLGPPSPTIGTAMSVGGDPRTDLPADHGPVRRTERALRVWPGPDANPTGGFTIAQLVSRVWTVSPDVSRVGVRLDGDPIDTSTSGHETLRSFGLVEGAVQVTPAGQPIVMLANHPTTGGYPVIAVVDPDDIGPIAQCRPGTPVAFVAA